MPTDFGAVDAVYPLSPEDLPRQWVLSRDAGALPDGWARHTTNGWHLGVERHANLCTLRSAEGRAVGWVVEALAYLGDKGQVTTRGGDITLPVHADASIEEVERVLYGRDSLGHSDGTGLVGPWTAWVFGKTTGRGGGRIYVSPKHSVTYSPECGVVSATPNLIPELRRDESLSRAFDPLTTNSYLTFGLTAFVGVHRLLPNHYLNLETFEVERHWPRGAITPIGDGEEGAGEIVDQARRVLELLGTRYDSFLVYLSAGRDSRAVLALLQPMVEAGWTVDLSTTVKLDLASRTDLQAARRLARQAELPHTVSRRWRRRHIPEARALRNFARIGEARAGGSVSSPATLTPEPDGGQLSIGGMAGETGRAYFWAGAKEIGGVGPEDVARATKSPMTPAVLAAARGWLDGLPSGVAASGPTTLDLAYVEQRLGCWQAPSVYLFSGYRHSWNPMAEGFSLEAMLQLPEPYRASGRLQQDMVAHGWPELEAIPYNKPTGLLRLWKEMGRMRFHLGALRQSVRS